MGVNVYRTGFADRPALDQLQVCSSHTHVATNVDARPACSGRQTSGRMPRPSNPQLHQMGHPHPIKGREVNAAPHARCGAPTTLIVQPPTQPAHGPLGPGRTCLRHQLKSPTGMAQKYGRSERLRAPFEPLDWLNRFQSMMASRGKGRWDGTHRFQRRVGTATLFAACLS